MLLIDKALPNQGNKSDVYYVLIPGRVRVGIGDTPDPFEEVDVETARNLSLTSEQESYLEGTVLHSLVEDGAIIHLEVLWDGRSYHFPIPPFKLSELEPEAFYDRDTKALLGTRLRLPGLAVYANAVYYHQSNGRQAELHNLFKSIAGDATRVIDTDILRTRLAPGISALAMGGDSFLMPGYVGITRSLASDLLHQVQASLPDSERREFSRIRAAFGDSILNDYEMIVLRNPTTVYGACRRFKVLVVDSPGAAIYIRSVDIDLAGGDFDGDMLFAFDPHDLSGKSMVEHCIKNSQGDKIIRYLKVEDLSVATSVANKKGIKRNVSLLNLTWTPEKETAIMAEFKEKSLIGKAWYALVHYDFLTAHYYSDTKKVTLDRRLALIADRVEYLRQSGSESLLIEAYDEFHKSYPEPDWEHKDTYRMWVVLAYRAVSESCFPIYELIFDLRKGDGTPPYRPSEAISGLMGYSSTVDWAGMTAGGVWVDLLRDTYESLPRSYDQNGNVQVDIKSALSNYPAFFYLVNRRRDLSAARNFASVQALGIFMSEPETIAQRLSDGLLYGTPL